MQTPPPLQLPLVLSLSFECTRQGDLVSLLLTGPPVIPWAVAPLLSRTFWLPCWLACTCTLVHSSHHRRRSLMESSRIPAFSAASLCQVAQLLCPLAPGCLCSPSLLSTQAFVCVSSLWKHFSPLLLASIIPSHPSGLCSSSLPSGNPLWSSESCDSCWSSAPGPSVDPAVTRPRGNVVACLTHLPT